MTGVRRFGLVLLWVGLAWLSGAPTLEAEDLQVKAKAFVIMDAKSGDILLSYNPQLMLPPASTLKVMTAMYVMEKLKLEDTVTVSPYAAAAPPSKIGIKPGETYTVRELLYALLLSSANDGARALAERVSGSEEEFARQLTQKVRSWGAYRTLVANSNGLPAELQFTTAQDLALLFRRAMENPELARIMGTKYYHIRGDRELRNHNRFLFTTPMAVAGKTGFTRVSRHTFVGQFRQGDKEIIISLMGSPQKWADLRELIQKGFELEGVPIAKMEPLEEKLWFAKKHTGSRGAAKSKAKVKKRPPRLAMGSAVALPGKKPSGKLKSARARQ